MQDQQAHAQPAAFLASLVQSLEAQFPQRLVALPGGGQVAWRESGAGQAASQTVVLLHGISSGAASWLGVARQLAGDTRVLAWDAPGYGPSTPVCKAAPEDADYAKALEQSLQALGVSRCVLVGHSLGALIAARFAACEGAGMVEQLVLISPAGGYGAAAKAEQRSKVREGRLQALADQGVAGLAAVIDQRLLSPRAGETARQWVRWNTAQMNAAGYAQAVELLCCSDLGQAVGRLTMPVQVWVGEQDVVTPSAACEAWAQQLGAHYATLTAAGHASPVEQPAEIARRLHYPAHYP